ncbi:MAG: hypothetical protein COW32_03090 [Candidatus Aquicultor secundus]|uniref:Uncharacterized protein n=1 Tax=Candidatus Aquicultor secundus TaxID=1973895 RepID=A0A2M7TAC7_9ACTN|nr:hypothetical protein [Candidatus Aquicultor secundus]NCO65202.1 hypothetical protein [Solirubrobacter sp.]OIO87612.1 MAG: hypothetical protein AUK32_03465 [Candidatus Aquicultor secundus]PIU28068.1 MAG: hypothetical protein COT10_00165 [Candidatus Aquicultor secundus]PIW22755.1 MAG: hypothetical protein COW32_03090 [Candidatus Aquicultor secundus]PIX53098.1 MAG: hypothetical protein COZ51_00680 [Candidatus Aquicultor secundus]
MRNLRRIFALAAVAYLIASLVGLGGVLAGSSAPLSVDNAKGESLTVGSVSVSNDGSNLSVVFSTDSGYKLNFTVIIFRGNPGGVTSAMSYGRTQYLISKSDNNHSYSIPLSEIKNSDVTIFASADVVVNGKKAFMNVEFKVPETERSTTTQLPTTTTQVTTPNSTSSTAPATTSTTVGQGTTSTTAGQGTTSTTVAGATSLTVAPTTTTTQVGMTAVLASATSTSVQQLVTTTSRPKIPRKRLPFTGMEYNWYLIGAMLALTGVGLYAGSICRSAPPALH